MHRCPFEIYLLCPSLLFLGYNYILTRLLHWFDHSSCTTRFDSFSRVIVAIPELFNVLWSNTRTLSSLQDISERDMEILDLLQRLGSMRMGLAAISVLLLDNVSPRILPLHPPDQHARVEDPQEDETKNDRMAFDEPRRPIVDVRAHDRETLAEDLR